MSINTCKLSGVQITKPVIDKVNGYIYQKDEIEKHLLKTSQCPITGREMQVEDLHQITQNNDLPLKSEFNPSQKVPSILKRINTEWENIQIYNFHLKKELEDIKKESSHLLYQHESANLVISRLLKEKDEYLNKLNYFKNKIREVNYNANKEIEEESEFDYMGITEDLAGRIAENSTILAKGRKNKTLPKNFVEEKNLRNFKISANFDSGKFEQSGNNNINDKEKNKKTNKSKALNNNQMGFSGIDINPQNNNLIITCNNNADIAINYYNQNEEKFEDFIKVDKVNTKKTNFVKFSNENNNNTPISFISGSNDNSASFFSAKNNIKSSDISQQNFQNLKFKEIYKITNHTSPLIAGEFHPLNNYALFASKDGFWSMHNLTKGICITKQISENKKEINSFSMHPDGGIFAVGENSGSMKIWDLSEEKESFTFDCFERSIDSISFSGNGYHLACGSNFSNSLKIYDLRKLNVIKEINLEKDFDLKRIKYDNTGNYLGYSGKELCILNAKNFENILTLGEDCNFKDTITDFCFTPDSRYIACASLDRTVKIFSN